MAVEKRGIIAYDDKRVLLPTWRTASQTHILMHMGTTLWPMKSRCKSPRSLQNRVMTSRSPRGSSVTRLDSRESTSLQSGEPDIELQRLVQRTKRPNFTAPTWPTRSKQQSPYRERPFESKTASSGYLPGKTWRVQCHHHLDFRHTFIILKKLV